MTERVDRVRDMLREELFAHDGHNVADEGLDSVLREALYVLFEFYPVTVARMFVPDNAVSNDVVDLRELIPSLYQLLRFTWPVTGIPALYTPYGAYHVLFNPGQGPMAGSEVEVEYRHALTVEGFDGATVTMLPEVWDRVWVKAAAYVWVKQALALARAYGETDKAKLLEPQLVAMLAEVAEAARPLCPPVRLIAWGNIGL